jgi:hypothetical protein
MASGVSDAGLPRELPVMGALVASGLQNLGQGATTPPVARLGGSRDQRPLRRGAILVAVTCPAEACAAGATGTLRLPGRAHALRLRARRVPVGQGQTLTLRLALSRAARAVLRRALRTHRALHARLLVTVTDTAGNAATATRTVRLVPEAQSRSMISTL